MTLSALRPLPSKDAELIRAAVCARDSAMPDITGFKVGASVRAADGSIFSGANAEVVTGHIEHAERAALSAGRRAGHRAFTAAAVAASGPSLISPCGSCRDWLNRHLPAEAPVHCYNIQDGEQATYTVKELLPYAPRLEELAHEAKLLESIQLNQANDLPLEGAKPASLARQQA